MHGAVENETAPDQLFADKSLGIKFYSVFPCSGTILVLWFPAVFKLLDLCIQHLCLYRLNRERKSFAILFCSLLSDLVISDAADNKMGY